MDILGIDIGTVSVKYVRCRWSSGKSVVVSQGDYNYRDDFDDLRLVITDVRAKEGSDVDVVIGISSSDIIKKTFTIPIVPKKEQREAINWTASKTLSVPLEEMVHDHMMIGQIEEKGIMKDEVLFLGAQKSYIERILATFQQVGFLQISLVTDIAFGYVRALGNMGDRSVGLIDIGGKRTGLYIMNGGILMFVREILTASESFTDALMSGPGFTFEQAERYKKEKGFDFDFGEVLDAPFGRLAGEIRRTFSVYNQRYPDQPVTRILLTGRGANIPGLLNKFQEALLEEVDYLRTQEGEDKYVPIHALCVGYDSCPNLIPEGVKSREQVRFVKRYISIGTGFLVAILLLLSFAMWSGLRNTDVRVKSERKTFDMLKQGLAGLQKGEAPALDVQELSVIKKEIGKTDVTLVTLLKYLSSRIPTSIYLRSVEFGDEIEPLPGLSAKEKKGEVPARQPVRGQPASVTPAKDQMPDQDHYRFVVKGYAIGEPGDLELILFNFVLSLRQSGFIDLVEITGKEIRMVRNKPIMEFSLAARCGKHEL